MPKLLTQAEYARHRKERGLRGATRQAVGKKVKAGAIPTELVGGKVLIDPAQADAAWDANTQRTPPGGPGADTAPPPADGDDPKAKRERLNLNQARTVREAVMAKRAQTELDQLTGKLLKRQDVEDAVFEAVRIFRDQLRGMPAKLAPRLALAQTPQECQALLAKEVNSHLEELSRKLREAPNAGRTS